MQTDLRESIIHCWRIDFEDSMSILLTGSVVLETQREESSHATHFCDVHTKCPVRKESGSIPELMRKPLGREAKRPEICCGLDKVRYVSIVGDRTATPCDRAIRKVRLPLPLPPSTAATERENDEEVTKKKEQLICSSFFFCPHAAVTRNNMQPQANR